MSCSEYILVASNGQDHRHMQEEWCSGLFLSFKFVDCCLIVLQAVHPGYVRLLQRGGVKLKHY
jgi:hypothetical protein